MWALLAVTPSVQMSRIDVGGNRAGTQTGYTAYGMNGQVRVLIEGINTTEGTGGAGFYFDYASLEEAFLGTQRPVGGNAEPRRAVAVHRALGLATSSRASITSTGTTTRCRARTCPTSTRCRRRSTTRRSASTATRSIATTTTTSTPAVRSSKDKLWFFGTYRKQFNAVAQPNFQFDKTFDTKLWNAVGKVTYQVNQKNKLIGYYQWGQKMQPNRLPFATYTYASPEQTFKQDSGSWVYKGEWNGTRQRQAVSRSALRRLRLLLPADHQQPRQLLLARHRPRWSSEGAHQKQQLDRDRKQIQPARHLLPRHREGQPHLQDGRARCCKEQSWEGFESRRGGDEQHRARLQQRRRRRR